MEELGKPVVKRGIEESQADYWCHVTPLDRGIYVYRRTWMLDHMVSFPVQQTATAIGFLVPCEGIAFFQCALFFRNTVSEALTGKKAEQILWSALAAGCLWWQPERALESDMRGQIAGIDFKLLLANVTIECKLDARGGLNGTGNLFVQTHQSSGAYGWKEAIKTRLPPTP